MNLLRDSKVLMKFLHYNVLVNSYALLLKKDISFLLACLFTHILSKITSLLESWHDKFSWNCLRERIANLIQYQTEQGLMLSQSVFKRSVVKKIKETIMDPHHAYKSIAQREGLKKTQRHFEEQDEMPCSSHI